MAHFYISVYTVLFNSIEDGAIFLVIYIGLRVFCGGYHAKTHELCFISSNFTFFVAWIFAKVLTILNLQSLATVLVVLSTIVILILAPIRNKNHPLSDKAYKKKFLFPFLCFILLLLIGIGLMLYPLISNWYGERVRSTVEVQYNEAIAKLEDESIREAFRAAQEYNESLYSVQLDPAAAVDEYDSLLNLSGNGIMGYVEIPVIDVNLPIYHTVAESSLQKGAGHMPGTSLPIGGKSTHAVISAHSGMSDARMFTDLDKVQKGDLILLHVLGDTLAYAVDTITVTDPADIEAIEIRQDKDLVTLVTCTPYSVNTHRLLVRGHRIELTEEEITEETKATEPEASTWMEKYIEGIFFGFIIGGAVLVLVRALSKKVRENQ